MQENSVNLQQIVYYASQISRKICEGTFSHTHSLSKKDINQFSSVEQLNQILLKNLHSSWQHQYDTLQSSPYFDYDNPEVRESIENLIKLLPKHIKIIKKDFLPLLNESVKELLLLVLDPLYYFQQQLHTLPKSIVIREELEDLISFYTIHQEALAKACNKLKKTRIIAKRSKVLREIEKAIGQSPPLEPKVILAEFDNILPLPDSLLERKNSESTVRRSIFTEDQPKSEKETPIKEHKESQKGKQEATPNIEEVETIEAKPHIEEANTQTKTTPNVIEKQPSQVDGKPASDLNDFSEMEDLIKNSTVGEDKTSTKITDINQTEEEKKIEEPKTSAGLDDKNQSNDFADRVIQSLEADDKTPKETTTPYEKLQQEDTKKISVHEKLVQQSSRKLTMSMNQRLRFINKLFRGNKEDFQKVVNLIESQATYQEIMNELKRSYMPKYDWELTNETIKDFFSLIDSVIE